MGERKITWAKKAIHQLSESIAYIGQDSPQNAEKAKEKILKAISQLSDGNVVHRKDSLKENNDGSFLYFEVMKYRVCYQVRTNDVLIVQIIHTSREPKSY